MGEVGGREYKDDTILQSLTGEIAFTHNVIIFTKCKNRLVRQFYIESTVKVGGEEFFIDLLLYHRELQCLVAIELKTGKFKPEYQGKMEFYLNVLNDLHKKSNEKEAIGIIICREKNRLVVEYSLKKSSSSIGISSYSTCSELPEYYKKVLPSAERIEKGLERWMEK